MSSTWKLSVNIETGAARANARMTSQALKLGFRKNQESYPALRRVIAQSMRRGRTASWAIVTARVSLIFKDGVIAAPRGRIQFDFILKGARYRPSIKRPLRKRTCAERASTLK